MASQVASIPRFLLPRLTWRGAVIETGLLRSTALKSKSPSRSQQRTISSPTWRLHKPIYHPKLLSNISWAPPSIRNEHLLFASAHVRRSFHTTSLLYRDHHFDTLKFVQRLKEEGFSEEQATAMMRVLSDVIEESIQNLTRTMVLREGISSPPSLINHTNPPPPSSI